MVCIERVHCANVFWMVDSHSLFTTKPCACAALACLEGIFSFSVDFTQKKKHTYINAPCGIRTHDLSVRSVGHSARRRPELFYFRMNSSVSDVDVTTLQTVLDFDQQPRNHSFVSSDLTGRAAYLSCFPEDIVVSSILIRWKHEIDMYLARFVSGYMVSGFLNFCLSDFPFGLSRAYGMLSWTVNHIFALKKGSRYTFLKPGTHYSHVTL
jgi:hypothetical protein